MLNRPEQNTSEDELFGDRRQHYGGDDQGDSEQQRRIAVGQCLGDLLGWAAVREKPLGKGEEEQGQAELKDEAETDVVGISCLDREAKVSILLPLLQYPEDTQSPDVLTSQSEYDDGQIAAFKETTDPEKDGSSEKSAEPDVREVDNRP